MNTNSGKYKRIFRFLSKIWVVLIQAAVFWGVWTLWYNLKTAAYTRRFLDAYGREKVEPLLLRTVAMAEIFG